MNQLEQNLKVKSLRESEKKCLSNNKELVSVIKRIPHLPLDLDFDLQKINKEAELVTEYSSHKLHPNKNLPQWYYEHHSNSFRGQCLVDYTPHGTKGMIDSEGFLFEEPDAQFDDSNKLVFFETPWGAQMPYTLSVLKKITPYLNRTRLIRTPPKGGIYWHSHHNGVYQNAYLRLAVIILTLQSNNDCTHGVRDYRDPKSKAYYKHYEPGTPYLFNSWHDHEFWNHGQTDRLTLICYLNFPDQILLNYLSQNIKHYKGELIPE